MNLLKETVLYSWKVFVFTLIAVFLMVILQRLKVGTFLVSPKVIKLDILDSIRPKLEQKVNNFHLKKTGSLIQTAGATGDYDQASAYIAVDLDSGQVLTEKNATNKLPIASLTKLMTAIVALDLAQPADIFTISSKAANIEPTKLGLITGQKLTLEELLNGSLLTSANDASQVIKEGVDAKYGQSVFIDAMNLKAKDLGLKNSHFENPQGFDGKNHYSSAADLAILTAYAIKNYPLISGIVKKDYQFYPADKNHKQIDMYNWNGLVDVYPGVFGVKIGNTGNAGYTTIVGAKREDKRVITVLLGAPGVLERDLWASQVLDLGFQKLAYLEPVNITTQQLKDKYSTWKYWN